MNREQELLLPNHIVERINYYRWKKKINNVNKEYHQIFFEESNGKIFIRYKFLKLDLGIMNNQDRKTLFNDEYKCVFNFRHTEVPNHWKGISRIKRLKNNKYSIINNDYYSYENLAVCIEFPLPARYCFTSGLNDLRGFKKFIDNGTQELYNVEAYFSSARKYRVF